VYWDLFQQGNQNRSAGNNEAIFVLQTAYDVPGGLNGGPFYEQVFSPRLWQANIQNLDGSGANLVPVPNVYTGGRAGGFVRHNYYFSMKGLGNCILRKVVY
jgi:starch-binding outer membrane protein, SusD/RagB family